MDKILCKTCYREFEDSEMARDMSGQITTQCRTCEGMLGKGPGYANEYSEKEMEEWFEGVTERREQL